MATAWVASTELSVVALGITAGSSRSSLTMFVFVHCRLLLDQECIILQSRLNRKIARFHENSFLALIFNFFIRVLRSSSVSELLESDLSSLAALTFPLFLFSSLFQQNFVSWVSNLFPASSQIKQCLFCHAGFPPEFPPRNPSDFHSWKLLSFPVSSNSILSKIGVIVSFCPRVSWR